MLINNKRILYLIGCYFFSGNLYAAQIPKDVVASLTQRAKFGLLKGVVVGVVDKNGADYFSYGVTADKNGQPVDENTIFEIGSITKTFTASLLADAALRNEVSINAPISTYLPPSIKNQNLDHITLQMLVNHHSGLATIPSDFSPSDPLNPYADYTAPKLYEYLQALSKSDLNMGHFQYSNTGAGLAGHLLTLVTSQPYANLLKTRITDKLGMHNTFIGLPEIKANVAAGHNGAVVPNWTFDVLVGAGGILSSAKDMLLYLQAQFNNKNESLAQAFHETRQITKDNIYDETSIGLGWFIVKQPTGEDIIYHDGNTYGYWSFAGFLADGSKAVVVLSNSGNEDINDVGFHVLNELNALQEAPQFNEITLCNTTLKNYQGRYSSKDGFDFRVTLKSDTLYVAFNEQNELAIYPKSSNEFFYRALRAEIVFGLENGEQTLTLIQNGEFYTAKKVVVEN